MTDPATPSGRRALIVLDAQTQIVGMFPNPGPALEAIKTALVSARASGDLVIFVNVAFLPGHPEVSPRDRLFGGLREHGLMTVGSPGSALAAGLETQPEDLLVTKQGVSAFVDTELDRILRNAGVVDIAVVGYATSGAVLSTVRSGHDLGYSVTVYSDACADFDDQVHDVLMTKVFPMTATVGRSPG